MKKLFIILAAVAMTFVACKKENKDNPVNPNPPPSIAEQIIGKWITSDADAEPVVTNEKLVIDFVSTTEAYVSASFNHNPAAGTAWIDMLETGVTINGDTMNWTALREDENGQRYTATFEMSRVF